jgi:hypothetical protein
MNNLQVFQVLSDGRIKKYLTMLVLLLVLYRHACYLWFNHREARLASVLHGQGYEGTRGLRALPAPQSTSATTSAACARPQVRLAACGAGRALQHRGRVCLGGCHRA